MEEILSVCGAAFGGYMLETTAALALFQGKSRLNF